jgi:hypothetical protein
MDSKIIRFHYELARNEAHVSYHEAVTGVLNTHTPDALGVRAQYDIYTAAYAQEVEALDIVRRSELTTEIEQQDRQRDIVYRGFADTVKGATKHFDFNRREAALKIKNVVGSYGNIAHKAADQETAAIDDLLRELLAEKYRSFINLLNLNEWLEQLRSENENFKALVKDRYNETSERPDVTMKKTRKAVDAAFRTLLNQIDALVLVQGLANYDRFIHEINAISEHYRNILAQEEGERKAAKNNNNNNLINKENEKEF